MLHIADDADDSGPARTVSLPASRTSRYSPIGDRPFQYRFAMVWLMRTTGSLSTVSCSSSARP